MSFSYYRTFDLENLLEVKEELGFSFGELISLRRKSVLPETWKANVKIHFPPVQKMVKPIRMQRLGASVGFTGVVPAPHMY